MVANSELFSRGAPLKGPTCQAVFANKGSGSVADVWKLLLPRECSRLCGGDQARGSLLLLIGKIHLFYKDNYHSVTSTSSTRSISIAKYGGEVIYSSVLSILALVGGGEVCGFEHKQIFKFC
jgi:hypothetical protein